jgi:hypothetical protein
VKEKKTVELLKLLTKHILTKQTNFLHSPEFCCMLATSQQLFFHTRGYLILENVIPSQYLKALQEEADTLFQVFSSNNEDLVETYGCIIGSIDTIIIFLF